MRVNFIFFLNVYNIITIVNRAIYKTSHHCNSYNITTHSLKYA